LGCIFFGGDMLRFLTGGESHGKGLIAILEGIPSNLSVTHEYIDRELSRRQAGYGRGGRMSIEKDCVDIVSGVRFEKTIGSPITMCIRNKDWENWKDIMAVGKKGKGLIDNKVTRPRPGHADLCGAMKYAHQDIRDVLERSSARETAARVAVGAVCKRLLEEFNIRVISWVESIGGIKAGSMVLNLRPGVGEEKLEQLSREAEGSMVRSPDKNAGKRMMIRIDEAKKNGESLGGIFNVFILGVPPGLGSYVHWDRKLDGRLSQALISIQAIKGVEIGLRFAQALLPGSHVHDEIYYKSHKTRPTAFWTKDHGYYRKTNNAGGIEGGVSNGEPIALRAAMKPIPTLYKPLNSVDIKDKRPFKATVERSDICAVPAASVVGEAVVAYEIARAFLEKFGGDTIKEIKRNYKGYLKSLDRF